MSRLRLRRYIFLMGVAFLSACLPLWAAESPIPIQNEDCLSCHDTIDGNKFAHSVHSQNRCTSCHSDIHEIPHSDKLKPVDCGNCHRLESEVYQASDHGLALKRGTKAAACLDCHGEPHELVSHRDAASPVFRLNIPATCAKCHDDEEKMNQTGLLEKKAFKSYAETVHGQALLKKNLSSSAVCTDCHGSHDLHAPTNPVSKINRSHVPQTCGKCHENVFQDYSRSIHGKSAMSGKIEAPVCTDCHGEHTIFAHKDPRSSVYATTVSEKICGHCHAAEKLVSKYRLPGDRLKTYFNSYHGLASKAGVMTVANCASCHGAHDILPSNDPRSSVHKTNLPQTCGKCHANVNDQLAKGNVHLAPSAHNDRLLYFVSRFYIYFILLIVGGMLLHNIIDFSSKLKAHRILHGARNGQTRFTANERIQHAILGFSFLWLAYSGFAHKFSDAWWALPFKWMGTTYNWRGLTHRGAAIVFTVLGLYHLFYLLFTARGRQQLKSFALGPKDLIEFYENMTYRLGLSKKKPHHGRYSYVEKVEYWALLWGTVIMVITGSILTFNDFSMSFLPKWAIDLAGLVHFYEAILATLAIVIWHLYFTIFDPDYYPLHLGMSGPRKPRRRKIKRSASKK